MKGGIKKALRVPTRSATPKISFTQEKIKYVGIFGVKIRVKSDKTKVHLNGYPIFYCSGYLIGNQKLFF
ncbi:hypothetical protein D0T60_05210 [Bacteroides sp. 224]|nr:hypothetical protein [Bacteroides sp. 224]